jgi:predicted AAA+ superfamily ATPase
LELALKEDTQTYGVGRIQSLYMYPLSFDEFLVATEHSMWVSAKQIANANQPVQEALHEQLTNSFRTFLMTGGMPASVVAWLETNDYLASQEEIEHIADSYYEDFKKYAKKISPDLLTAVLQSAVLQIGSKFVYSHVEGGYSIYDIKKALGFLCDAGILSQVQHTAANGLPLGVEINKKFTKYILLDSGLLLCLLNMNMGSRQQITEDILTATATDLINKGSLTEMVAGLEQIKYASPKRKYPLYYWENLAKGTTAEVDYILSRDMQIVPLEVKAGTSGKMKSLRIFMEKKKITRAIRCSLENFSRLENDGIDIIPLYALSNLFRD